MTDASPEFPELPPPDELPLVERHFPTITPAQRERLGRLLALLRGWNERVNLVSRKDVEHLEDHHLLHALTYTRVWRPAPRARVLDIGTGGGLPGLPLAMLYPECEFTLLDSIAKKCRAVAAMAEALGLANVRVVTARVETVRERYDYVLGRAVTALPTFLGWARPLLRPGARGVPANGVLYLKGNLYREELAGGAWQPAAVWPLDEWVPEPFFEEKFLLHFPVPGGGRTGETR